MSIQVEIFGAAGVAIGHVAQDGPLRLVLEAGPALVVEQATWHALDGSTPHPRGTVAIAEDDILLAVTDAVDEIPVHAQWHAVALDVGPYRVAGQMPTMPGFDPGRAITRPTGEFVLLRDVRIGLTAGAEDESLERAAAFVNRYVVERVAADLMLGFFFPGAEMTITGGHDRVAAGVASPPATATGAAPARAPFA